MGCFFHLSQCLAMDTSRRFTARLPNNPGCASWLRCLPALAFLPHGDVEEAFDDLLSADGFDPRAQDIANYFEDTYIGYYTVTNCL